MFQFINISERHKTLVQNEAIVAPVMLRDTHIFTYELFPSGKSLARSLLQGHLTVLEQLIMKKTVLVRVS